MAEIVKRKRHDGHFNKQKRSKPDILKITVGSYLTRRHYSENEVRKNSVSCEEMVVSQLIDKEVSRPNSILFSNSSYRNAFNGDPNPVQVDSYFCKFISWINGLPNEFAKKDLSGLVCPLFCHLYLDLLQSSSQQAANIYKFYQEQKNIHESVNCSQIVKELILQDVKSRPVIKSFRSSKYKLKLSLEATNILKNFLSKHGHILILQVLQAWFDIEIDCGPRLDRSEECDLDMMAVCNGDAEIQEMDEELREVQDVIRAVNNLPPSLLLINVFNSQDNSTCGLTSSQDEKVVVGFSTSEIRVWGMGNALLPCSRIANNAARITLACDNISQNAKNPYNEVLLTSSGAAVLRGHGASIQDVTIIAEADVLLSVSQDCTMRAWKFSDYSCAAIYRGHNYPIWCMDKSSFGMYIATGSVDRSIRIWTLDRTHPIRICAGHSKDVNCVQFHPNATYLASGSIDKTIRMWSVADGKSVRLLLGHSGGVYSVAFSPNGQYLASAGEDNCVRIWDLTAAKQLTELVRCTGVVSSLNWSKNGQHLSAASLDGFVRIWNMNSALNLGISSVEPCSVYNTEHPNLLSLRYDDKWLTCLSASTSF